MAGAIISVINEKGGVGKTTVVTNLADALGRAGKRVCVVDNDHQCNTTKKLLPSNETVRKSIYDILNPAQNINSLTGFFYASKIKNVTLIPNVQETAILEPAIMFGAGEGSFQRLKHFLNEFVAPHYDYVLIDLPPSVSTLVICAAYASTHVIVPIMATSSQSIEGLGALMNFIKDMRSPNFSGRGHAHLQNVHNPDLKFLRILINGADRRTTVSKNLIEMLRSIWAADEVFKTEIPFSKSFFGAEAADETIFQHEPSSAGARSYRELSKEFIEIIDVETLTLNTKKEESFLEVKNV